MEAKRQLTLEEENLFYLRSWAGATDREIHDVLDQIASLEHRAERLRQRLDLITRLADLVEAELGGREPTLTLDLTEDGADEDGSAQPELVVEGINEIFDEPS